MFSPVAVAACAINLIIALILGYVRFRRQGRDWLELYALGHLLSALAYALLIPYPEAAARSALLDTEWGLPISLIRVVAIGLLVGATLRLIYHRPAWRPAGVVAGFLSVLVLAVFLLLSPYAAFVVSIAVGALFTLVLGIITCRGPSIFYQLVGISWIARGIMVVLLALSTYLPNGQVIFETVGILNLIFVAATGFTLVLIEFDDAREQAQQANLAKTQFIANMSHELRTPLNAILGFSELLEGRAFEPSGAQIRNYASLIQEAGKHLLGIINALLDMASIEARRENLRFETIRLDELVELAVGMLGSDAGQKGVRLQTSGCDTPLEVVSDSRAIRQILLNLAGNAVKFSPRGGTVEIALSLDAGSARISVSDQGPGIDAGDLRRIFEPFWQAGDTFNRSFGGVGLGLAIAQSLTQALGATLAVDSVKGRGTTFTIILPLFSPQDVQPLGQLSGGATSPVVVKRPAT